MYQFAFNIKLFKLMLANMTKESVDKLQLSLVGIENLIIAIPLMVHLTANKS